MNRKLTLDITIIVSCLAGMLLSYAYLEEPVKRMTSLAREQIEVIAEDATGREEILFAGILKSVEYKEEGQYATLHIRACSYTWKMDIGRRSRSFQDRMMTYRDVAESVVREYGASMSWEVPDRQLTHPLVQYQETDYCFLRRILSHLGTDVISIDRQEGIKFRAGLADGMAERRIDLDSVHYSVLPFRNRIACENRPAPYIMGDCQYGYEVRGLDRAEIGNRFSMPGNLRNWLIWKHTSQTIWHI